MLEPGRTGGILSSKEAFDEDADGYGNSQYGPQFSGDEIPVKVKGAAPPTGMNAEISSESKHGGIIMQSYDQGPDAPDFFNEEVEVQEDQQPETSNQHSDPIGQGLHYESNEDNSAVGLSVNHLLDNSQAPLDKAIKNTSLLNENEKRILGRNFTINQDDEQIAQIKGLDLRGD